MIIELESEKSLIKCFQIFDDLICELMAADANLEKCDKLIHLFMTLPTHMTL